MVICLISYKLVAKPDADLVKTAVFINICYTWAVLEWSLRNVHQILFFNAALFFDTAGVEHGEKYLACKISCWSNLQSPGVIPHLESNVSCDRHMT